MGGCHQETVQDPDAFFHGTSVMEQHCCLRYLTVLEVPSGRAGATGGPAGPSLLLASKDNLRVELKTQSSSSNLSVTAEQSQSESLGTVFHKLRATNTTEDDIFDSIMDAVGEFGIYQRGLVALSFLPNLLTCFFMFIEITLFSAQKAYCNTSWILAVGPNLSEDEQLNLTLPRDANGSFLNCLMYLPVNWDLDSIIQFGLNETQSCNDGWIYPKSKTRSLINEFDLVCGKEFNMEDQLTVFLAGLIMGSLVFGFISDRLVSQSFFRSLGCPCLLLVGTQS
ncbi:solute carrier family 22 member 14-like [Rhynchonycteris naso]